MNTELETSQFDNLNSDDILAKSVRLLKQRENTRLEAAEKFKNPHGMPKDKDLKTINDDPALKKVLDTIVAYWQEEAFNMGYKKALTEVLDDIKFIGI